MAGDDYNNLFSADYWTPEGYARRKAAQKKGSQSVANYQSEARGNEWEGIGNFFGGIGDWLANDNPGISAVRRLSEARNAPSRRESSDAISPRAGVEASARQKVTNPFADKGVGRISREMIQEEDPLDELWDLLNQQYGNGSVDTSFLDEALNSQLGAVNDARNQAQETFRTADSNVAGMHDAFRNDVLAQAPKIQEQNQKYQADLTGIFDKTLQENAQRQALNKQQDAEMMQRLGIAPAANQPDLVGQEIESGNQRAVGSRDARLAESATIGNSELERNTGAATAIGNMGVQARSELNQRLQDILGDLGGAEADIRSQYATSKGELGQQTEQRNYERFMRDRDWNLDRYNNEMDYRQQQAEQAAQGNTVTGFNGLQQTTDPNVQRAVNDLIATEPNLDVRNPNQVLVALKKKHPNATPEEIDAALTYITNYNNLGSNNKFPVQ